MSRCRRRWWTNARIHVYSLALAFGGAGELIAVGRGLHVHCACGFSTRMQLSLLNSRRLKMHKHTCGLVNTQRMRLSLACSHRRHTDSILCATFSHSATFHRRSRLATNRIAFVFDSVVTSVVTDGGVRHAAAASAMEFSLVGTNRPNWPHHFKQLRFGADRKDGLSVWHDQIKWIYTQPIWYNI